MANGVDNCSQTKDMIAEALFRLMNKKEFPGITIKELTETAQVARRTFYKNFEAKEDVIDYRIRQIDAGFTKELFEKAPANAEDYGLMFFTYFKEYAMELMALHRNNLLFTQLYYIYSDAMKENEKIIDEYKINNTDYNIAYRFGGMFFMLAEWLDNGTKVPPEEMARYFAKEIPESYESK